ncbi:MAG TPA: 1-acyl-sn-glycerol-3-phosphate acyltransferase [Ktedonobacterales bacterium]|nr:1-acyl-sn-glycerol-3-phosphate acyltransferase [Ktedonobacterales bacterium]
MRHHVSALGRFALAAAFASIPRLTVSVTIRGLEYDTGAPRTFYAITHKRDFDAFVPLPTLLAHRGLRALANDVRVPMRADGFQAGFLSRIVRRPAWFSRAIRPLNVGPILEAVGIHPLDSIHLRPEEAWIREAIRVDGDAPIGELFAPATAQTLASQTGVTFETLAAQPASTLLQWRYFPFLQAEVGAEIFAPAARRRAELRVLATAKRQLNDCVEWLRAGGSLYTAPEGRLSGDGRFSPFRAGLARVMRAAPPDTRVQPIAIVYDYMRPGRLRMWIELAPAIEGGSVLTYHELEQVVRASWLSVARFTCTQLASGLLMSRVEQGQRAMMVSELEGGVFAWARELFAAGRQVDPSLLTEEGIHRRLIGYLTYAELRGIIRHYGDSVVLAPGRPAEIDVLPGDVGYRYAPLRYAANEVREMVGAAPAQSDTLAI